MALALAAALALSACGSLDLPEIRLPAQPEVPVAAPAVVSVKAKNRSKPAEYAPESPLPTMAAAAPPPKVAPPPLRTNPPAAAKPAAAPAPTPVAKAVAAPAPAPAAVPMPDPKPAAAVVAAAPAPAPAAAPVQPATPAAKPASVELPKAPAAYAGEAALPAFVPSPPKPAVPPVPTFIAADDRYLIGPEDVLDISVWRDDTLKGQMLVRPDGGISFPLVGEVRAAGRTAAQVQAELVQRLEKFMPDPVLTVSVIKIASYRIFVLGRVNKPGDFTVGRNIDVLQALSMAGGITPFASEDKIQVIRKVDGKNVAIPFHYSRVRRGEDLAQNIGLQSGDVLLVP